MCLKMSYNKDNFSRDDSFINLEDFSEKLEEKSKTKSLHTISMIIFFLVIFLFSSILVLQISVKSSNAVKDNMANKKIRVASSYMSMIIKQNDSMGSISLINFDDKYKDYKGILIKNYAGIDDLKAAVFYKDGWIYESIYEGNFDPELSEKVIEADGFEISMEESILCYEISYHDKKIKRYISLRSVKNL